MLLPPPPPSKKEEEEYNGHMTEISKSYYVL